MIRILTLANKGILLYRAREHRALDQFAQGAYFRRLRVVEPDDNTSDFDDTPTYVEIDTYGPEAAAAIPDKIEVCAVGCAITDPYQVAPLEENTGWHHRMANEFGIPHEFCSLADTIFERFHSDEHDAMLAWAERFFNALPSEVNFDHEQVRVIASACVMVADGGAGDVNGSYAEPSARLFERLVAEYFGYESAGEDDIEFHVAEAKAVSERERKQRIRQAKLDRAAKLREQADQLEREATAGFAFDPDPPVTAAAVLG